MNLTIPSSVYKRLRAYVLYVTTEISFLGKVTKLNNYSVVLEDIFLLPQTVSAGHTTLDQESLGQFYDVLMQKGEDPSPWRAWIHSHAEMQAFYSQTDENTIESFDLERPEENWFLSIVVNRAGTLIPRIDVFSPYRFTIKNIEWDILFDQQDIKEDIRKEVADKVSTDKKIDWSKRLTKELWLPQYLRPRMLTP